MASRCQEKERSARDIHSSGSSRRPTAHAAELALAVLAAAGPPQSIILGHLEPLVKRRLGSTCTSLRQASLAWFPEVAVRVTLGAINLSSLAAWLERHQTQLTLVLQQTARSVNAPDLSSSTIAALPAHLVSSLTASHDLPAAVSTLTALTSLRFRGRWHGLDPLAVSLLAPLSRLRQLDLSNIDVGSTAEEVLALPALTNLQALALPRCKLHVAPRALSGLTHLTALNLSINYVLVAAPLATLQRLRSLQLGSCSLAALPQQLSTLTALTSLVLSNNSQLHGGWQHLLSLNQLQAVDLSGCGLTAVPEQLSALVAVTRLDLSNNRELKSGRQHLQPLIRLQDLNFGRCKFTAVPLELSALTALTRLCLGSNPLPESGWKHLPPLSQQCQSLDLSGCSLTAVPEQLSTLTALTRLDLSRNSELRGGWQHLLPLTQLRDLSLSRCDLEAVPEQLSKLGALPHLRIALTGSATCASHLHCLENGGI
ncbi:hypothetical protein D9Q98_009847 [Chlorella vulgaris]|uniref:Uncharacterized protein n=1 Tax=Chlorella vulgaris TaxID=3077 RepID=A0A9D4TFL7_CHLVU|nr:hypothetical protein D9Q98_009847 [Chlorella vulgaris]